MDASNRISTHIKEATTAITNKLTSPTIANQQSPIPITYTLALINPPPHANPKLAAREGIKARQFALSGLNTSSISHLTPSQIKDLLNNITTELGLTAGKIRTVSIAHNTDTIIEADSNMAAKWLALKENQKRICEKMDPSIKFSAQNYKIIAYNVPTDMDPKNPQHITEICKSNNLETDPTTITSEKWAKAIENRNANQRTAHLYLTFNSTKLANRAITNRLHICNKKCQISKYKREPIRCLKCQGWNHIAKDCIKTNDTCRTCAGQHRTSLCTSKATKCVSCKTNDHTSWSWQCPMFKKKMIEFNNRNLENSTLYFPTSESWTWTATANLLPTHRLPTLTKH